MTASRYDVSITREAPAARFEMAGRGAALTEALHRAGLPVPTAPKAIATTDGAIRVAWIGPRRMLIGAPLTAADIVRTAMMRAIPAASSAMIVDVTGSAVTFQLQGRDIADVLAQGVAHDLSMQHFPAASILATEGWGVGLLLERDTDRVRVTVDTALAAYVENCLRTAAGQAAETLPGTMQAPPPAIAGVR